MKLSTLISDAIKAMEEYGDIDVCIPCDDETIDEGVQIADKTLVRKYGDKAVPLARWKNYDHDDVFVIG